MASPMEILSAFTGILTAVEKSTPDKAATGVMTVFDNINKVANAAAGFASIVGGSSSTLASAAGFAAEGIGVFSETLGPIGAAVAAVGGVAFVAIDSFLELGKSIASIVQASNPATAEIFGQALNDLTAVFGSRLEPVLRLFTQGVYYLGDAFNSILPSQESMRAVFESFYPILEDNRAALAVIAPYIKAGLTAALYVAGAAVQYFIFALRKLTEVLTLGFSEQWIEWGKQSKPLDSSFGMAARKAEYMNAEDISKKAIISALEAAGSIGQAPDEQTANNTASMDQTMKQILTEMARYNEKHPPEPKVKGKGSRV